ncbi:hypothetical protein Q428_12630 [Fervidicella metallireducens AeB]|uniref:Uncharacterized protein n=1 Tax=Fervidicella metallireducens AeB TaxID=1403537 RepID=A0A017RSM1_9CLOT|nr:hypothetical protein [Fervidicella metallireducens]EYE87566.1 hypothetical protein Q428_12630 [Fervidicella metallireducens AeB]
MKKILSAVLTIMFIFTLTLINMDPVKAATEKQKKVELKAAKELEKTEKKALTEKIKAKKLELKALMERNKSLREDIKNKRQQIKSILAELNKSKDNPEIKAKLDQVNAKLLSLQPDKETLKNLRMAGKPFWEQFKANISAKNIDAALLNLEKIASIRDSRYEALAKINKTLDEILEILKK